MTKKHVNLLFLLMLCNVASMRADLGFVLKGLLGFFKVGMNTIFWPESYNRGKNNVSENFFRMEVETPKTWVKWFAWKYGWQTRKHAGKLEEIRNQRVNAFFAEQNADVANRHNKQMKTVSDIYTEVEENKIILDAFKKEYVNKSSDLRQEVKKLEDDTKTMFEDLEQKDNERGKQQEDALKKLEVELEVVEQKKKELETLENELVNEYKNLQGLDKSFVSKLNEADEEHKKDNDKLKSEVAAMRNKIGEISFLVKNNNQTLSDLKGNLLQLKHENVRDTALRKTALNRMLSQYVEEEARVQIVDVIFSEKRNYLPYLECTQDIIPVSKDRLPVPFNAIGALADDEL